MYNRSMSLKGEKSFMVVLQVEGSHNTIKRCSPYLIQGGGDDAIVIFGIN